MRSRGWTCCAPFDFEYIEHVQPQVYGNAASPAWGGGGGIITSERLADEVRSSKHPALRSNGLALPNLRGVIMTAGRGKVIFDLIGRTAWVTRDGKRMGRQLMTMLLESDHDSYVWLDDTV